MNNERFLAKVIFGLIFCFVFCVVQAQQRDYHFRFSARIMDADTAVMISNCHIINRTQNLVTISDNFGDFYVTANIGDTLTISSMGYETLTFAVHDSMYTNNRIIKLQPAVYVLTELDIGLLSTYDRFRRDILSMEAQQALDMAFSIGRYDVIRLPDHGGIRIPLPSGGSIITALYNLWSVEGKQYRHYLSVINGTAEFIIIGEKFNGAIVRQLTGLENDELIKFMSWCGFTKKYLLATSEMEIRREVMRKFREYVRE